VASPNPNLPRLLLTPPDTFIVEELVDNHLVKKFPDFYGSGGSLVRSIETNRGRLSLAKSIQSTISGRFFVTSVLILSPNLYALLFQAFSALRPSYHPSLACYKLHPPPPPDLIENWKWFFKTTQMHRRGLKSTVKTELIYVMEIITKQVREVRRCSGLRVQLVLT
jgi:hypothetical protein